MDGKRVEARVGLSPGCPSSWGFGGGVGLGFSWSCENPPQSEASEPREAAGGALLQEGCRGENGRGMRT